MDGSGDRRPGPVPSPRLHGHRSASRAAPQDAKGAAGPVEQTEPGAASGSWDAPIQPADEPASFVILLWLEPRARMAEPEWRWRVKQVQTGEQAIFRRVADMLRHVADKAGVPEPQ